MATRVRVEGVEYTKEAVEGVRHELVTLRDEALSQTEFHWSVLLSHAIAYMSEYAEVVEEL